MDKLSERKILDYLKTEGSSLTYSILLLSETDSTNRYAKELAIKGAAAGTVVLAERQSAGRGRLGRSFYSPEESGIYMSVLLRPNLKLEESVRITSMAAVAVARAIERVSGIPTKIKWVNDIFLQGKKVCGILTESGIDYEQKQLQYVVLGIGVNVGNTSFPKELETIATSIRKECQRKVSRNELIAEILKELTVWYPSLWDGSFLKESKARSNVLGKEIRVQNANAEDGFYRAKAVDLDDLGQLMIETTEGERKILNSGEVSVRF